MRCLLKVFVKSFSKQQRGFTLLEVLVAMSILGFIGVGFLTAINTTYRSNRIIEEQTVATNLATEYLEAMRATPYSDTYPNIGDGITVPLQYSITVETLCSGDGVIFDSCSGSENETLQRTRINVSRTGGGVLSICTYRSKR